MPKVARALSPLEVRRITKPGLHAVGEVSGLCLLVKPVTGARSWVLRTMVNGRRSALGLGGYPTVTLAQARERAREALDSIRRGVDPAQERRAARKRVRWTFRKVAEAYIESHRVDWKNPKHAGQWSSTLSTYAYPTMGELDVATIGKGHVLQVIEPIWNTKRETANRLRNRIELVLSYAVQREYRPDVPNPARWRGNLDQALPAHDRGRRAGHFEALPIDELHGFMQRLQAMDGMGARALEFAILTAARSGEVRGACWSEVDLDEAIWRIPADRMKAGRDHRIPLSEAAIELLKAHPRLEGTDLIFPGMKVSAGGCKPLSDMTLTACIRRMKVECTVHGFRSSFRDWCAERTSTPSEVAEMALAHAIGDQTEAAYRRGDLFDKRRALMDLWARFLATPPSSGKVLKFATPGANA